MKDFGTMKDCEKYKGLLMGLIDDELTPEEAGEVNAHLIKCAECREEYEELRTTAAKIEKASFEEPTDDRRVVENVYSSLRPGGVFLVDVMGKEVLARIFRERDWYEIDGIIHLAERKVSRNWSWMENRWILLRGSQRIERRLSHRLYAATELTALLSGAGFGRVATYGDFTDSPYDHTARRLVAVGVR